MQIVYLLLFFNYKKELCASLTLSLQVIKVIVIIETLIGDLLTHALAICYKYVFQCAIHTILEDNAERLIAAA